MSCRLNRAVDVGRARFVNQGKRTAHRWIAGLECLRLARYDELAVDEILEFGQLSGYRYCLRIQ